MSGLYRKQPSVDTKKFAMVPRSDVPRASFKQQKTLKTTFDAGFLVPFMAKEIIPGDTLRLSLTAFCRLATPIFPFMDNLYLETFFFFVPNRLVWTNWVKFMGEQDNPADSISFTVPQIVSPVGGYVVNSFGDMFGLPTVGQMGGGASISHSALPFRMYNLIYNQWFKDENLIPTRAPQTFGDGPDAQADYVLRRRGKRHDYFTSALPWTQKGGVAATVPLTGNAPVWGTGDTALEPAISLVNNAGADPHTLQSLTATRTVQASAGNWAVSADLKFDTLRQSLEARIGDPSSTVTTTVNALRLAIQTQRFLEKDARGGTRYTEIVRSHFGVTSPDARLQRSEYLGGGRTPIAVHPIQQTSATGLTGGTTPIGNLSAAATALAAGHGFSQSFTEHGYVIGIAQVTADLTYQQGLQRHWSRSTRYDFPWPVFAQLGEQSILNKEIYCVGNAGAGDDLVFGYQERYAEMRYDPSQITGLFRSTSAGTIDAWHLSQRFTALPTLGQTFIEDNTDDQLSRVLAVGAAADGKQLLFDGFFDMTIARPMPLYGVPGLMDHF